MIYTLTCNPAVDCVLRLPDLRTGQLNRACREDIFPGGKGINVSHMLKNLGHPSVALGFSAGPSGVLLKGLLDEAGIASDLTPLGRGMTRINVKLESDTETEVNAPGPDVTPEELDMLFAKADALREGDCLVLSGSIPPSLPDDLYETLLRRLSGRSILTAVDASGALLRKACSARPFLIKPNLSELGGLFGDRTPDPGRVLSYAERLQEEGARNILVSMGEAGAVLVTETGSVLACSAPAGKVRGTVGSGDSMVAGFLCGYLETGSLETALRMGVSSGSASAFSDGYASRQEAEALMPPLSCRKGL